MMILGLLLFLGLAVDVGYLAWQKRRVQAAADAAAVGAALELQNGNTSNIVTAGRADSALNGFTNGVANTTVTLNNPPVYGSLAGNTGAVEAIVSRSIPTFFMMLVGQNSVNVTARAVARKTANGIAGCIFVLNPSAYRAFQVSGSNATYSSCSVLVASSHSTEAFEMEGSGTLYMRNSAGVGVVGNWNLTGQTKMWDVVTNKRTYPVHISVPADPLASINAPTSGTLVRSSASYYDMNNKPAGNTVQPGIYCGGLAFGTTGGATFTMAPGTYIIAGGGFSLTSQALISAVGVTIYNTNSTGWGCPQTYAYGPVNIDGQATLTMSAPTSGSLAGIAFFQDRNITGGSDNKIQGGAGTHIDGALYMKGSGLTFSGNNDARGYLVIVADKLYISGNSMFNNDYSSLGSSNPFKPPSGGGLTE